MSSFDPPLSRTAAALLALGALLVIAFVVYAAHTAPPAKTTVSNVHSLTFSDTDRYKLGPVI